MATVTKGGGFANGQLQYIISQCAIKVVKFINIYVYAFGWRFYPKQVHCIQDTVCLSSVNALPENAVY